MNCAGTVEQNDILYRFALKNNGENAIAAIRINYVGLAEAQRGLSFSPVRPAMTYDYNRQIPAGGSVLIEVQTTGLPRTTASLRSSRIPCSVLAVRYSDGSIWSVVPGIAVP